MAARFILSNRHFTVLLAILVSSSFIIQLYGYKVIYVCMFFDFENTKCCIKNLRLNVNMFLSHIHDIRAFSARQTNGK